MSAARGVYAPVLTPFRADGKPCGARFLRHCRWLLAQGTGLAVFGTNSEASSLSVAEKRALLDTLLDAGRPIHVDAVAQRYPDLKMIMAHMGHPWIDECIVVARKRPNVYTEVGAILAELGRQPRAAHDFFVKYQDRILFGKDSYQPDEYPYYWRTFETGDEYFDYYRNYHAFWKLYGMSLPDDVLRKLYYRNALRIVPGLSGSGFPD